MLVFATNLFKLERGTLNICQLKITTRQKQLLLQKLPWTLTILVLYIIFCMRLTSWKIRIQETYNYSLTSALIFLLSGFRQTWKTWKTWGILCEASYFDFFQILIGVTQALSSHFDHFVIFVLIVGILIFIMQLPLYLADL